MSETKIFRKKDLDLEPVNGMKTIGLVNVSFSDKLGAGIGVFEDCSIPWHITYDEVINIRAQTIWHVNLTSIILMPKKSSFAAGLGELAVKKN